MKEITTSLDRLEPGCFYGERQLDLQVRGLTLTDYRYAPHQEIPRHSHSLAYFCVVLQGGYSEQYGRLTRECSASALVFHPEDETHSDRFHAGGGHIFSVETESAWIERVREYAPTLN